MKIWCLLFCSKIVCLIVLFISNNVPIDIIGYIRGIFGFFYHTTSIFNILHGFKFVALQ